MASQFKDSSILVVNPLDSSRKMLQGVLKVLGVGAIDEAFEASDAFRKFKEKKYDIIFSALMSGVDDAIKLADMIRNDGASPNNIVPIVAIGGNQTLHLMDAAREKGMTDFLQAPFTVDDVANRLRFILSMQQEQLENASQPQAAPQIEHKPEQAKDWPDEEEAISLTEMLLEHYMRHHEIVLTKLKFTQEATRKSIDEIRATHEKMRGLDNTNIHQFSDFEKMWEEIISMFVQGGLPEDALFEIEKLVSSVPSDIKKHYDELSQQDKSFLALVESLNSHAYKKAKEKVVSLQEQPNPLHGRTDKDYKAETSEELLPEGDAMMFAPKSRGAKG